MKFKKSILFFLLLFFILLSCQIPNNLKNQNTSTSKIESKNNFRIKGTSTTLTGSYNLGHGTSSGSNIHFLTYHEDFSLNKGNCTLVWDDVQKTYKVSFDLYEKDFKNQRFYEMYTPYFGNTYWVFDIDFKTDPILLTKSGSTYTATKDLILVEKINTRDVNMFGLTIKQYDSVLNRNVTVKMTATVDEKAATGKVVLEFSGTSDVFLGSSGTVTFDNIPMGQDKILVSTIPSVIYKNNIYNSNSEIKISPTNFSRSYDVSVKGANYSKNYSGLIAEKSISFPDGVNLIDLAVGEYTVEAHYSDDSTITDSKSISIKDNPITPPPPDPNSPNPSTPPTGGNPSGQPTAQPSIPPTPVPTVSDVVISPNPSVDPSSSVSPSVQPSASPSATPTPVPTPTPTPTPDDNMIAINYPIVSTTESEKDDTAMIASLETQLDNSDRYAMNNSYSIASFSTKATKGSFNFEDYKRNFLNKFNTFLSSKQGQALKTYHQIKDKQVFIKHLVYIHNLSKTEKEASISGTLEIQNSNSEVYAQRHFNWKGLVAANQIKKVVISDPNLVWYGRNENRKYINTNNNFTRFGPYLAENGEYICKLDETSITISPNFDLLKPTQTPTKFNTFNIDSDYSDYVSNGVPKFIDNERKKHIRERHKINYLTNYQKDYFSKSINNYKNTIQNILKNNKNKPQAQLNAINREFNTFVNLISNNRDDLVKGESAFPQNWTDKQIFSSIKSLSNLEEINDSWSNFGSSISEPKAYITGIRNLIPIETRIDNYTYGSLGGVSTAIPKINNKNDIALYYLKLVTDAQYKNDVDYLLNNFNIHLSRLESILLNEN